MLFFARLSNLACSLALTLSFTLSCKHSHACCFRCWLLWLLLHDFPVLSPWTRLTWPEARTHKVMEVTRAGKKNRLTLDVVPGEYKNGVANVCNNIFSHQQLLLCCSWSVAEYRRRMVDATDASPCQNETVARKSSPFYTIRSLRNHSRNTTYDYNLKIRSFGRSLTIFRRPRTSRLPPPFLWGACVCTAV